MIIGRNPSNKMCGQCRNVSFGFEPLDSNTLLYRGTCDQPWNASARSKPF